MRYGVSLPNFGGGTDARTMAELAREAEEADWEGFFVWDHLLAFSPGPVPVVDPWVALTAAALTRAASGSGRWSHRFPGAAP